MALIGKALANQVPDATTGHQARLMFGAMSQAVHGAYETLANYDLGGIAAWTGIDAGSVAAARTYLDDTRAAVDRYYAAMPYSDDRLSEDELLKLRTSVSISSAAVATVDDLFGTSWVSELSAGIVEAAGTVTAKIAGTVSNVAGSFVGGTWWIWLGVIVGVGLYLAVKGHRG